MFVVTKPKSFTDHNCGVRSFGAWALRVPVTLGVQNFVLCADCSAQICPIWLWCPQFVLKFGRYLFKFFHFFNFHPPPHNMSETEIDPSCVGIGQKATTTMVATFVTLWLRILRIFILPDTWIIRFTQIWLKSEFYFWPMTHQMSHQSSYGYSQTCHTALISNNIIRNKWLEHGKWSKKIMEHREVFVRK